MRSARHSATSIMYGRVKAVGDYAQFVVHELQAAFQGLQDLNVLNNCNLGPPANLRKGRDHSLRRDLALRVARAMKCQ